ncbi:unnamed protein product, partial [Closterium sp. NIES-54]
PLIPTILAPIPSLLYPPSSPLTPPHHPHPACPSPQPHPHRPPFPIAPHPHRPPSPCVLTGACWSRLGPTPLASPLHVRCLSTLHLPSGASPPALRCSSVVLTCVSAPLHVLFWCVRAHHVLLSSHPIRVPMHPFRLPLHPLHLAFFLPHPISLTPLSPHPRPPPPQPHRPRPSTPPPSPLKPIHIESYRMHSQIDPHCRVATL